MDTDDYNDEQKLKLAENQRITGRVRQLEKELADQITLTGKFRQMLKEKSEQVRGLIAEHQPYDTPPISVNLIAAERKRQITAEGWTPEHDDEHDNMEIGEAARCYLDHYMSGNDSDFPSLHPRWPWDTTWWKPSKDPVRNLEKVGALIAAEIDRVQRERLQ